MKLEGVKVNYLTPFALTVCAIIFFIVSFPLASNNIPYLDDYYLIKEQELYGFWGPTKTFQGFWGYYRIVYTSLMSFVFSASDHIWALRTLGVTLHIVVAILLYVLVKNFLRGVSVALIAFTTFLFFPYAYEAIAWPSNVGQYPLAPFFALLGTYIVLRYGQQKLMFTISGAIVMGFSFWIHEQAGPIVVALATLLFFKVRQSYRRPFVLAVLIPVLSNLLLIFITRDQNSRLSGEHAASIGHLLNNAEYLAQLIRTTPLGDLYYDPAGIELTWMSLLTAVGSIICGASLFLTYKYGAPANDQKTHACSVFYALAVFVLMAGTYLVTLVPILLSPIPWHTGRVVYIPFLAFTFSFAAILELLHRLIPLTLRQTYLFALSLLVTGVTLWQAHALASEAIAFDYQIRLNESRGREASQLVNKERDLTDTSLLVVRGFPGSDNGRPQFGEHMIGMSFGEFRVNLGLGVYNAAPTPRFSFASGWEGLCVNDAGTIEIQRDTLTSVYQWEKVAPKNITYLIHANGKFSVNHENGPRFDPAIHPASIPACKGTL